MKYLHRLPPSWQYLLRRPEIWSKMRLLHIRIILWDFRSYIVSLLIISLNLIRSIEDLIEQRSIATVLLVPQQLHLLTQRQAEEPPALGEDLLHQILADSVIDHVEKARIQARLFEQGHRLWDIGTREIDAVESRSRNSGGFDGVRAVHARRRRSAWQVVARLLRSPSVRPSDFAAMMTTTDDDRRRTEF